MKKKKKVKTHITKVVLVPDFQKLELLGAIHTMENMREQPNPLNKVS